MYEGQWFHWVTYRALRSMVNEGFLIQKVHRIPSAGILILLRHRGNRYFLRQADRIAQLVEQYSEPSLSHVVGERGELLVMEGFVRHQFLMESRNTRSLRGQTWDFTDHNVDFIFSRDGKSYGVEVKNTLGYMPYDEMQLKIALCQHIGVRAVFVARMLPKSWVNEIWKAGGFALILKYLLYPPTHAELARRMREELGLPVDTPRALQDGTMARFIQWHDRQKP